MDAIRRRSENRTQTLLRGLRSSGLCVLYIRPDLSLALAENLPPSWPDAETLSAAGDAAVFDPFTAERVSAAKRAALASGAPQRIEAFQRRDGADPLWFELRLDPDVDADGAVRGLFVSVSDITEPKRREAALGELLYEVSHRSRNLLAILQSILGQTAENAGSVAEFEEKFRGRIASLARSQDLVTYANWQGARFRRLVEAQVGPFAGDGGCAPVVEGEDPMLAPNAALHLGLALHELAANSAAFGVLADGAGTVRIACRRTGDGHLVEWIETPARTLPPVASRGFGRTVLAHVVPRALGVEASYVVAPDGVHYAVDLPARPHGGAASGA